MLRAYDGGGAVRHCGSLPESAATTTRELVRGNEGSPALVEWRRGVTSEKRAQITRVAPKPREEPEGVAAPRCFTAFVARGP